MNCQEYQNLDTQQKIVLIGRIVHLAQNNSEAFLAMSSMIRSYAAQGEFEGVQILPERQQDNS